MKPASLSAPRVVVKKAVRVLELWDGSILVGAYPIGLGFAPVGHKKHEGDGRTPVGDYFVCTRNVKSRFYLSLGLSYPNTSDARQALKEGRINQQTCDAVAAAEKSGSKPPWDTALGGEIMIHGNGCASDWTAGCIAVSNDVMDILFAACHLGTRVEIFE